MPEFKEKVYGKTKRYSFSKIDEVLEIPYLIELQKNSYNELLETGLAEILKDFSPIYNVDKTITLTLSNPHLDSEFNATLDECIRKDLNYSKKLYFDVSLNRSGELIEKPIFVGDLPVMTDSGSFMINGNEKVIVSQLSKSPGVFADKVIDKNGKERFNIKIQPTRGAWLEFEHDHNGILWAKVDNNKKVTSTVLLKALSVAQKGENGDETTDNDLLEIFDNNQTILTTIGKDSSNFADSLSSSKEIYSKLKPMMMTPKDEDAVRLVHETFFDIRRYDLGKPGRYKVNKKLAIAKRISGHDIFVADDITIENPKTGEIEIVAKKGENLTEERAEQIQNMGVNCVYVEVKHLDNRQRVKVIGNNTVDLKSYLEFASDIQLSEQEILDLGIKVNVYLPVLKAILSEVSTKEELINSLKDHMAENRDVNSVEHYIVSRTLTADDLIATINYDLGLQDRVGRIDVTDHLGNKRVRSIGELLQIQLRKSLDKLTKSIIDKLNTLTPEEEINLTKIINIKSISNGIKDFFNTFQLAQSMDHINPISALTHKRKLSALGPGGLTKDTAGFSVRDIDYTHYGRMCPIETPEGQNIGLITSLALYAQVNEYGFLKSPYRIVDKKTGTVTTECVYLDAEEEDRYIVAQANELLDENNKLINDRVTCRYRDQIREFNKEDVDLMDVSPKQLISVATSLIPFLEHDDTTRALMGSNMQRQAVPLLKTEAPIVATGVEHKIAKDSGVTVIARKDGKVIYVSSTMIKIQGSDGVETYELIKFQKTNASTCLNQKPIVSYGDIVKKGDIIADGFATKDGELALGKNILVAFMEWEGYNYEDAVLISEELVQNDVFTSIHINEYEVYARDTQLGPEIITRDLPQVGRDSLKYLDEDGIIRVGTEVKAGDILVGKTTPKGETEPTAEEKLIRTILGEKAKDVKNTSLKLPHGEYGTVVDVQVFDKDSETLDKGVIKKIKVYIAQKRKISVGDKMAGRHGNKGVVSRVLLKQDMPFMEDGTPIQILLNPLGVPSRMNIGQVLEVHLGMVAKALNIKVETPVFDGAHDDDIQALFKKAGLPENGKFKLYDGRTGEAFENEVTVGYMYYLKLDHLVDDKIHARSTGTYSVITRQPLGGKAQFGGQRFGEMEVWALEAYGAAHLLQEMLTIKSDDVEGRNAATRAILNQDTIGDCGVTEAFRILVKELQSLGLDVKALNEDNKELKLNDNTPSRVDSNRSKKQEERKEVDVIDMIDTEDFSLTEPVEEGFEETEDTDGISIFIENNDDSVEE